MDEPNYKSTDKFVEQYQKKLRELRDLSRTGFETNVVHKPSDSGSTKPSNFLKSSFDFLKSDFQESLNRFEQQFAVQQKRYKDIQEKVKGVEQDLERNYKIKSTVESLQKLQQFSDDRKKAIEEEFLEQKRFIQNEIQQLNNEKEGLILAKKEELGSMLALAEKKERAARIDFEASLMLDFETFRIRLLEDTDSHNQRLKVLDQQFLQRNEELQRDYEEAILKQRDLIDDKKKGLEEELRCLELDYESKLSYTKKQLKSAIHDFETHKDESAKALIEFNEQLEQKRHFWELEKTKQMESLQDERFQWEKEKDTLSQTLANLKLKHDNELDSFNKKMKELQESMAEQELNLQSDMNKKLSDWTIEQDNKLNELKHLDEKIQEHTHLFETQLSEREHVLDSLAKGIEEKQAELQQFTLSVESTISEKQNEIEAKAHEESAKQKDLLQQELDNVRKAFEQERSEQLNALDAELEQKRQNFQEDLVQRRQSLIDQTRKEQRLEFDHLIDFEREKSQARLQQYEEKEKELLLSIEKLTSDYKEKEQAFEDEVRELQDEIVSLKQGLTLQKDEIKKTVADSSEQKFNLLLERYKSKFEEDLLRAQDNNKQLEMQLKQKDVELKDMSFRHKRLENQLNQRLMNTMNQRESNQTEVNSKVIRNQSLRKTGRPF